MEPNRDDGSTEGDATATVMATTELLEHILLHLDMKTLLFAQRVSLRFQGIISGSMQLQKKLFFLWAPIQEAAKLYKDTRLAEVLLLQDKPLNADYGERGYKLTHYSILNPLLFLRLRPGKEDPSIRMDGLKPHARTINPDTDGS
ncbi:hypothetical protein LTR37_018692 [Vermiconidia calcicola]|uniref:Uncharacterized protein n=1 Tax=Vermiconidia calcicola TaxID=1690605 RepID=A0ACC3MG94_9PEZI|nr:hypothetical protein LTR37_018692 [Vermiconidia calcicola]